MRILVTGSAGFIGSALSRALLIEKHEIIGIDNHNDYYDPKLKEDRFKILKNYKNYSHYRININDEENLSKIFLKTNPQVVINLAAQAGVRYSITNPKAFVNSNLVGFGNILEECRKNYVEHLIYASSSSVYGLNSNIPFSTSQNVDHPLSMYAATKKSNELMAHSYSYLFNLPTTGLRFFTVYGPWDRPDMALHKFAKAIINKKKITIFNNGDHKRDFTFIDDIVECLKRVVKKPSLSDSNFDTKNPLPQKSSAPWSIYNIGNNEPISLLDFLSLLEENLGISAIKEFMPLQQGDVPYTWADTTDFYNYFGFKPNTNIKKGINKFCEWFKDYYNF